MSHATRLKNLADEIYPPEVPEPPPPEPEPEPESTAEPGPGDAATPAQAAPNERNTPDPTPTTPESATAAPDANCGISRSWCEGVVAAEKAVATADARMQECQEVVDGAKIELKAAEKRFDSQVAELRAVIRGDDQGLLEFPEGEGEAGENIGKDGKAQVAEGVPSDGGAVCVDCTVANAVAAAALANAVIPGEVEEGSDAELGDEGRNAEIAAMKGLPVWCGCDEKEWNEIVLSQIATIPGLYLEWLTRNNLTTVGELRQFLLTGRKLTEFTGLGKVKIERIHKGLLDAWAEYVRQNGD